MGCLFFELEMQLEEAIRQQPALLIYDGLCGFCNGSVQWLLKHDKADRFRFTPQQSEFAQAILLRHGLFAQKLLEENSVYLVIGLNSSGEKLLRRSDVTVASLVILGGRWKWPGRALAAVPRSIRDAGYSFIARNRFRIAGRFAACPVPSTEQRQKFLGM